MKRKVEPIPRTNAIEPPPRRGRIVATMRRIEPGESFLCTLSESKTARVQARMLGLTIQVKAEGDNLVRVWRIR